MGNKEEMEEKVETTRNSPVFRPPVDIFEEDGGLVLTANMPGVRKEDVEVSVDRDELKIIGHIDEPERRGDPVAMEYRVGDFRRVFTLGRYIDSSKIEASMKDGVLTLRLPKTKELEPSKIEIQAG
jgi:HSP20 family protein